MSEDKHVDELLFKPLIDRYVDNPRFLRRGWLAAEIDRRIDDVEHPFILMTAEPGFGKSVFMAQLAHDHPEWPRYFIRNDQREPLADVSAHSLLLRIGYQLAARFPELYERSAIEYAVEQRVGEVEVKGEVIGIEVAKLIGSPFHQGVIKVHQHIATVSGSVVGLRIDELVFEERLMEVADLQHMALIDPARTLQRLHPDQRIVILIDALDEVRYHSTQNNLLTWLTNCPKLPDNVCFVLTARPPDGEVQLFTDKQVDRIQRFNLEDRHRDDFRAHLDQDVEAFVTKFVEEVRTSIQPYAHPTEVERFSREAVAKADGNIGYLDALARGIDQALEHDDEHTLRALLALTDLPDDIQEIYAFFLHQIMQRVSKDRIEIEDPETGEIYDKEVWPTVHRRMLSVLAVAREPISLETIQRLGGISADWIYLAIAVKDLSPFLDMIDSRYRFYHATLPEFLTDSQTKTSHETMDLYVDAVRWHKRIADHYLRVWYDPERSCDVYGISHLTNHLSESSQVENLRQLISKEWMQVRSVSDFLADIALAWPDIDARIDALRQKMDSDPSWTGLLDILIHLLQLGALHDRDNGDLDASIAKGDEVNQLLQEKSDQHPDHWDPTIVIRRGYTEKTQAQTATRLGDTEGCERHLVEAQNCFEEVLEQFQGGLSSSPSTRYFLSGAYNGLASVYAMRNRLKDAIKYYVLATQTDPTNTFAFWDYSALLDFMSNHYGSGWCAEAIQITEQTIPLIANSPDFVDSDLEMVKDRLARLKGIDNKEPEGSIRVKIIPT